MPKSIGKLPEITSVDKPEVGRPSTINWSKVYACSFGGSLKVRDEEPKKRAATEPWRKVSCTAKIKVQKKVSDYEIHVSYKYSYNGHNVKSLDTWIRSMLSPNTSEWLGKAVASEIKLELFRKII